MALPARMLIGCESARIPLSGGLVKTNACRAGRYCTMMVGVSTSSVLSAGIRCVLDAAGMMGTDRESRPTLLGDQCGSMNAGQPRPYCTLLMFFIKLRFYFIAIMNYDLCSIQIFNSFPGDQSWICPMRECGWRNDLLKHNPNNEQSSYNFCGKCHAPRWTCTFF